MSKNQQPVTVGAAIAQFLHNCDVRALFGVISIHNMPILDAINAQQNIRFIMARGEAGAANMADAYARTTGGLGVCLTSTGTAAGNAAGAMVEALTAGTPLLHITGQIETQYLDQDLGYIHEAPNQIGMLSAISKAAFRVRSAQTALPIIRKAVQIAMTAPRGPVSVEIPIDIQAALMPESYSASPLPVPEHLQTFVGTAPGIALMSEHLKHAKRPLLWLGGGARGASKAVQRLLNMGFGVVSSTQGRGIVPEDHPMSLGAYTMQPPIEAFYQTCDAMLVVGSRLRSNETLKYQLKLPEPLFRIDADPAAESRGYRTHLFACGDAQICLNDLADYLEGKMQPDPTFAEDLRRAHEAARSALLDGLGPYRQLVQTLQTAAGSDFNWVRDVTLSNSLWGNRELRIFNPLAGVHALGGGIGQGLAMGIGAAIAASEHANNRKTFALCGDGGFILNLGELATAVQERANVVYILMNDQRYGVIQNIQDAHYGGRRCYVDLYTPDYATLSQSLKLPHSLVNDLSKFEKVLKTAIQTQGPYLIEIDMNTIGDFKTNFAGPPSKT